MGVRGLTALLQRLAPESVKARQITHYSGRTLAVDVSCFLNRFIYGLDPHPARVQRGVHRLSLYLELNGIRPIFVFDMDGRITEKQRETERREVAKEKVQKSFRLEMKRKERVGSLKGPAMVLKSWTDEQLSAFLENTPANLAITAPTTADPAPPSVLSHSTHESGRSSSSDGPVKDFPTKQATLSSISTLEPLEDMSFLHGDEDENVEVDWLLELPESPDGYLSTLEGISSIPLVDQGIVGGRLALGLMDGLMDDSTEHDLATPLPKSLDLDLDSVTDIDLVPYLSLTEDRDGIKESESSLLKNIRTGTSMQQLIPASEFALLDFGDPTSPGFDRRVQVKVHAALEQFVKTMESPLGQTLLQNEHLNQRQKALSELEQKLVKDIKEAYRSKSKERFQEPATSKTILEGDTDIGSGKDTEAKEETWEEKAAVLEEDANTQAVTGLTNGATAQQDAWEEKVAVLENAVNNQAESGPGDDTTAQGKPWSEEDEKDASKGSEATFATEELELTGTANESLETKKTTKEGDAIASSENALVSETSEQVPDDSMQGTELEENRNLRSTIKDILSTHQSILMSLERRTMRVTKPLVTSCQELLRAMGQPVIVSEDAEAESVCARLVTLGLADGTVSEDTDTAVFGNGILIRQLGGGKNKDILEINPLLAHAGLGLSRDAFRDFCILCGTDFSGKMEGIGPHRAAKLIRTYGSIESIMANTEYKAQDDFFYDHARRVFDRPPAVPSNPQVYQRRREKQPQLTELFLKYDIDPLRVRMELIKEMETYGATGLEPTDLGEDPFALNSFGSDPFSNTQDFQSEMKL